MRCADDAPIAALPPAWERVKRVGKKKQRDTLKKHRQKAKQRPTKVCGRVGRRRVSEKVAARTCSLGTEVAIKIKSARKQERKKKRRRDEANKIQKN